MDEISINIEDVNQLIIADSEGEISVYSRVNTESFAFTLTNVNYEHWCALCWESYDPEESDDGKCPFCHGEGEPLIIPEQELIKEYDKRVSDNVRKKKIFINGICVFNTLS